MFNPIFYFLKGQKNKVTTATLIGPVISGSYSSGALAGNGCIYFIPYSASKVLKVNNAGEVSVIGPDLTTSSEKWSHAILAPNGKIYGIPSNHTRFLEINPDTDAVSFVGAALPAGANKYMGSVLGSDGMIYCICASVRTFLKFNPFDYSFQNIGPDYGLTGVKWWGGVLGADNNIYCIPYNRTKILQVDYVNLTFTEVGANLPGTGGRYAGAALFNDNMILSPRQTSNPFIYFNINSKTAVSGSVPGGSFGITPTNSNYFLTANNGVKEIDAVKMTHKQIAFEGSNFSTGVLAPSGKVYFAPSTANRVLEVTSAHSIAPNLNQWQMPSDVSQLPTSDYNKLYNIL